MTNATRSDANEIVSGPRVGPSIEPVVKPMRSIKPEYAASKPKISKAM